MAGAIDRLDQVMEIERLWQRCVDLFPEPSEQLELTAIDAHCATF